MLLFLFIHLPLGKGVVAMLKLMPWMGLLLLAVVASAGVAVGVELPARDQWVAFASDDGKVNAQFPKAPKENTQKVDSPIGPLKVSMHIAETGRAACRDRV